ncbi:MAG TPA: LuxR C-terminal-related transcriptional regulator [Allosphingosinicella sp.]
MADFNAETLELVGRLHEGVVDEDAWTDGLDMACRMMGSTVLLLGTVENAELTSLMGHRLPPEVTDVIGALYTAADNPWIAATGSARLRRPITVADLGGQEALERTRVWPEVYKRFGLGESAGAVIERQPGCAEVALIGRPSDIPFGPVQMTAFQALIPHLARAWRVKRALAQWESLAGTLSFVLDRLERAVVVTGPEGQVRFANRAADILLSRGDGIDMTQGRIRASRGHYTAPLLALIENAAQTSVGGASMAVDAIAIPGAGESAPLAIVAEPLAPAHGSRLGHAAEKGAILFISDSEASNRPSPDRLRIVYSLTAAEGRVASLAVAGHGVDSVADSLGVSRNTAKYHLKTIFEKVGVTRQSQLVRRVLADVGGLAEPEKMIPSGAGSGLGLGSGAGLN